MYSILLTDPEQRASLAAARALGRWGARVYTIGEDRGLAGLSRFTVQHISLPAGVAHDSARFREAIAEVVRVYRIDVIVPVTDRASRALLGADQELGAKVAGPNRAAYEGASDKAALLSVARKCGLRVPKQEVLASRGDAVPQSVSSGWTVVKPAHSVAEVAGSLVSTTVRYAFGREALEALVATYPAAAYPLMLQERIRGSGEGVFLLRQRGHTALVFAHRRLREKPPAGGVSTYRVSILPPIDLVGQCEALLDVLGYEGAAMIEFKHDAATGEHVLMEINARLWGSVQLAIDAGIDFPSALVQSALGLPITASPVGRVGVRSVWELGELDHMWALLRRSPVELQLPPGETAGLAGVLKALVNRKFSDRPEVFRWNDPIPFVAELLRWVRGH
jgi:predicted ATP-grasp superfamily ATP-dependent carboligase